MVLCSEFELRRHGLLSVKPTVHIHVKSLAVAEDIILKAILPFHHACLLHEDVVSQHVFKSSEKRLSEAEAFVFLRKVRYYLVGVNILYQIVFVEKMVVKALAAHTCLIKYLLHADSFKALCLTQLYEPFGEYILYVYSHLITRSQLVI